MRNPCYFSQLLYNLFKWQKNLIKSSLIYLQKLIQYQLHDIYPRYNNKFNLIGIASRFFMISTEANGNFFPFILIVKVCQYFFFLFLFVRKSRKFHILYQFDLIEKLHAMKDRLMFVYCWLWRNKSCMCLINE